MFIKKFDIVTKLLPPNFLVLLNQPIRALFVLHAALFSNKVSISWRSNNPKFKFFDSDSDTADSTV